MFIEIVTKNSEHVVLNINNISFVSEEKNHAVIFDINGVPFVLNEDYQSFRIRLVKLGVFKIV